MRYAPRIGKTSMFILFFVSFLENNENVLSELCSAFYPNSHMWTYGSIAASAHIRPHCKETTARGDRHATVAKTATVQPVCSTQSPDRIAAVTLGAYAFQWLKSPRQLAAFGWLAPYA